MNEAVKSVVNILVWLQDLWYYRYITFKKGVDKRMEIEKAYEVLYEYFSKRELQNMYREKGFDGSETDTIRKHKYNEELLNEKARSVNDEEEQKKLRWAASAFRNLVEKEHYNV